MDLSLYSYEDLPKKFLFMTGGPGSGKGTLCEKIIKYLGYRQFSVGDLMRYEIKNETDIGLQIKEIIK